MVEEKQEKWEEEMKPPNILANASKGRVISSPEVGVKSGFSQMFGGF